MVLRDSQPTINGLKIPGDCCDSFYSYNENSPVIADNEQLTQIQKFYVGQNIFVTGGTGFIGKLLIEKLLRCCPGVGIIYVLIRSKREKSIHQRLDEIFDDPVFNRVRARDPKFRHQIVGISGDCGLPFLGISDHDKAILTRDVSIVFHVAATVKFDEDLKNAVAINVAGTLVILDLCKKMTKLKSAIYVSTAYSNCNQNQRIEEKCYDMPITGKNLISVMDSVDDKMASAMTEILLGNWPNAYSFTKAAAEDVIRRENGGVPVGIFRPAMTISTYQEPEVGWADNFYGPIGVMAGACTGMLRLVHCDETIKIDLVPGDMVVNAMMTSAWDVANLKQQNQISEVPVYNFVSRDNPITCRKLSEMTYKYNNVYPSSKALWYYGLTSTKYKPLYLFYIMFVHWLPALLIDGLNICTGRKPRLMKEYKKIHRFVEVVSYFLLKEQSFSNERLKGLSNKMSNKDRKLFFFDMEDLVWEKYFQGFSQGMRLYLLKDPVQTLPEARVRWNRLFWLHQILKYFLGFVILRFIWMVISWFLTVAISLW